MKILLAVPVLLAMHCYSQEYKKEIKLSFEAEHSRIEPPAFEVLVKNNLVYNSGYVNNIPRSVISDFLKNFDGAKDIKWYVDEKEVTVYCNFEGKQVNSLYKRNGLPEWNRLTYDSSYLADDVRKFAERETADQFKPGMTTEIRRDGYELFQVTMVNQKRYCVLQLSRKKGGGLMLDEKRYYTAE